MSSIFDVSPLHALIRRCLHYADVLRLFLQRVASNLTRKLASDFSSELSAHQTSLKLARRAERSSNTSESLEDSATLASTSAPGTLLLHCDHFGWAELAGRTPSASAHNGLTTLESRVSRTETTVRSGETHSSDSPDDPGQPCRNGALLKRLMSTRSSLHPQCSWNSRHT